MPPPAATQAAARLWTARVTNPPHLPAFLTSVESTTTPAVQTPFTRGRVRELKNGHNPVTVQNRTHVYMNFFHHNGLGNHLLQLCPKVVKHPVYIYIYIYIYTHTELFKMIVGVLTTCHTQYSWDRSICIFSLIEQHSKFLWHTLQVLYMCTLCDSTNINTKIEFVPNCL